MQPSYAPSPYAPPPAQPASPAHRPRRGLYWLALLVALAVCVVGGIIAVSSYLAVPGPEATVTSYFNAVATDDASKALGFGDVPAGSHAYLTAVVLRDQLAVARIGHVSVLSVSRSGDHATVSVQYPLRFATGTQTVSDSVPVIRRGGKWRLTASAIDTTVQVSGAQNRISFAGTKLPDESVVLFPGAVPIVFDTPNLQLASGKGLVGFSGGGSLDLDVQLSATGKQAVSSALDSAVSACLATKSTDPLCPVPSVDSLRVVPGSLHGSVSGAPSSNLQANVTDDPNGLVSLTGSFAVNGKFTALDFNNQPTSKSGQINVQYSAKCFATAPSKITWNEASS